VGQLPRAYRSLPRPSSPAGAKTSPTCPYELGRTDPAPRLSRASRPVRLLLPARVGRLTIPSLKDSGLMQRFARTPAVTARRSCWSLVKLQLLPHSQLSKNKLPGLETAKPAKDSPSLRWPGVEAPLRMPRPAPSESQISAEVPF